VFVLDSPHSPGLEGAGSNPAIVGAEQLAWIEQALRQSSAVWKIIASDMPIGLVVPDGLVNIEAIANSDPGVPLGRELEIASLLASIKQHEVRNVVWLTADVHDAAAPLRPGTHVVHRVRSFLGVRHRPHQCRHVRTEHPRPDVRTVSRVRRSCALPHQPPTDGRQYHGVVEATRDSLDVPIKNIAGTTLYSTRIDASD
jgi:alkaline phosphatase D